MLLPAPGNDSEQASAEQKQARWLRHVGVPFEASDSGSVKRFVLRSSMIVPMMVDTKLELSMA
jgi:hypothetical protein